MLEFVFVFPILMVITTLTLDVGRLYMAVNSVQYATSYAVRQGAVYGQAGIDDSTTTSLCSGMTPSSPVRKTHLVLDAFCVKLADLPGGAVAIGDGADVVISIVDEGGKEIAGGKATRECSKATPFIKLQIKTRIPSIAPGIDALLGSEGSITGGWPVSMTAVAKCEVLVAE
jgi:hypothetical protein